MGKERRFKCRPRVRHTAPGRGTWLQLASPRVMVDCWVDLDVLAPIELCNTAQPNHGWVARQLQQMGSGHGRHLPRAVPGVEPGREQRLCDDLITGWCRRIVLVIMVSWEVVAGGKFRFL